MPAVFRSGPYRFFFYASDRDEPIHIHVEHDEKVAKYWLDPAVFKHLAATKNTREYNDEQERSYSFHWQDIE